MHFSGQNKKFLKKYPGSYRFLIKSEKRLGLFFFFIPENLLSYPLRKGQILSESEVLQMQTDMNADGRLDTAATEELIDVLIAISVIAKRLAQKLRQEIMQKEENQSE